MLIRHFLQFFYFEAKDMFECLSHITPLSPQLQIANIKLIFR